MITYYAHSRMKYNTEIEKYELSLIDGEVINPNGTVIQGRPVEEILKDCFELIDKCDRFVFSTVSGTIGKGCFEEIFYAMKTKKKVCLLDGHKIRELKAFHLTPIKDYDNDKVFAIVEVDEYENEENNEK